jgi:two-component system CheB/CheR fusion protein
MKNENKPAVKSNQIAESLNGEINPNQGSFSIVGIGASAGGLEALEQLFTNMPDDSGFAFIVVQHLSPDHKGMLGELLHRFSKMKVYTVSDRMKVKPNSVYVIPSNQSISILNGTLHLFKPSEKPGFRLPIDLFFFLWLKIRRNVVSVLFFQVWDQMGVWG